MRTLPTFAFCYLMLAGSVLQAHELEPLPASQWSRDDAQHLLRRAGFGGTAAEVDALFAKGLNGAVDSLVNYDQVSYTPASAAMDPRVLEPFDRRALRGRDRGEIRKARQERRRAERVSLTESRLWWFERLVESPRPFEEKMTLFWHGHFTSGARKVRRAEYMHDQNAFLRQYALANFRELLQGISRDPAMLMYLDNARNSARSPNENYARELLELFTLGEGNYSETDIRAAARAFTGWTLVDDQFQFRKRDHDYGPKRIFGKVGNWNGDDVIDMILDHKACSRYLAEKLLVFFVCPEPPKPLVNRFAAVIRRNNFNMKESMRSLLLSKGFYDPAYRGALIKSPVELLVGIVRQLNIPLENLNGAVLTAGRLGQNLYQPPNVKGWDGHAKWINTATLFGRYNAVRGLLYGEGRGRKRAMRPMNDEEAAQNKMMSRREPASQPPYDPSREIEQYNLTDATSVVDHFAGLLLPVPLDTETRTELAAYLEDGVVSFNPKSRKHRDRVRTMIFLLCSTPEYQLN